MNASLIDGLIDQIQKCFTETGMMSRRPEPGASLLTNKKKINWSFLGIVFLWGPGIKLDKINKSIWENQYKCTSFQRVSLSDEKCQVLFGNQIFIITRSIC